MAGDKPKSAAVRTEEYEAQEYLEGVAPISKKLQEQFPGSKFDPKSTALLISQIQQLNEDALGIKSMQPRPFPKLPTKLFQDMRLDGTLHSILSRFQTAMIGRSLKRVDFTNPHHRNKFLDILAMVMHDLLKQGVLQWPKVYIHPSCGGETSSLQTMVGKMRGEVAASPDAPGVTHHIFPFGPKGDPDDGVQYMRNLGRRGDKALVHWWYYPDSYDELVSLDSAPEVFEPDKQPEGVWKLYLRWVKDSIKYNEWMNPIDYEMDDVPPAKDSASAGQQLAASNPTPAADVKRKREDSEAVAGTAATVRVPQKSAWLRAPVIPAAVRLPEVTAGMEIAPGLIKQQLLQPDPRALRPSAACIDLSQGQGGQRPPAQGQEGGQLPAHASWFRYDATHANEVRGCPLFFRNPATDKTAQYKEVRNTLVDKYRVEPSRRLTFTEARKLVARDAEEVLQVWRVLDRWGIINSLATDGPAETDTSPIQLDAAGAPAEARVTSAASLEDAEALFRTRRPPTACRGASAAAGSTRSTSEPPCEQLNLRNPSGAPVKEARFFCNAMPEVECTQLRYHCTKLPDLDLCPQAYADGRFPAGCTARDFVRIDQSDMQAVSGIWSDQDTLLMLEGLELFGDNWAEIADHVGTKSQVQCIMHFLRLPVEDEYLDQLEHPGKEPSAEPKQAERGDAVVPFAEQSSPVMAQVAFLAGMVGPRVAAAAAQRALEVLMEEDEAPAQASGEGPDAPGDDKPPSEARVRAAAAAAWDAAAAEARLLAEAEEREVRQLLRQAVSMQAKLVDQRMKHFAQLQQLLLDERPKLRAQREAATRERIRLQEARQQPLQARASLGAPALHPQLPTAAACNTAVPQSVPQQQAAQAASAQQPPPG